MFFWALKPCTLVGRYQRLEKRYLQLKDWRVNLAVTVVFQFITGQVAMADRKVSNAGTWTQLSIHFNVRVYHIHGKVCFIQLLFSFNLPVNVFKLKV
jgi:hypothetical protein